MCKNACVLYCSVAEEVCIKSQLLIAPPDTAHGLSSFLQHLNPGCINSVANAIYSKESEHTTQALGETQDTFITGLIPTGKFAESTFTLSYGSLDTFFSGETLPFLVSLSSHAIRHTNDTAIVMINHDILAHTTLNDIPFVNKHDY